MAQRRATDVLASLASAFPELYDAAQQEPGEAAQAQASTLSTVASADLGSAMKETKHQDAYEEKITRITGKFESKRVSADELEQYLHKAELEAKEAEARALAQADAEFTPAWRNTGLPMKPSHLQLDAQRMTAARLVNPKAIMSQYQQVKAKEVLTPPRTYEYNDTSIQPNYLNTTTNQQTRKAAILPPAKLEKVRAAYLRERAWPHLGEEEVAARIAASEERRRVQDLRMPATQYDMEKKIIASMHHKLTFLRNPRYPTTPALKALQSQFIPGPEWGASGTGGGWESDGAPKPRTKPPIKSDMTAHPERVFLVEPEEVVFSDYEVGRVYSRLVKVRNLTQVVRSLRLLPPASQYFHMSLPRMPQDNSCIAPGMAAEVVIRFTPDSLADYDDEFVVDTAENRFSVALKARRPPPALTLPPELHVGEVVCGNRKVQQFRFQNLGGQGRFRVIPSSYWPERYEEAPHEMATVGPFEVWPLYFDLASGAEVVLSVAFEPHEMGVAQETLVLVCDNCQVKDFTIRGLASDVDVQLESIDGLVVVPGVLATEGNLGQAESALRSAAAIQAATVTGTPGSRSSSKPRKSASAGGLCATPPPPVPPDPALLAAALDMPLWFGEVVPGSGFTKRLTVRNTTTLPFPFEWSLSAHPQTRSPKAPNMPLGLDAPEPQLSATAFDGHNAAHQGKKGQVDLVALGMESESVFQIIPNSGVLQPGERVEFCITFLPPDRQRYVRWAQLKVDKSPSGGSAPSAGCDVGVLEVGLEGVGTFLDYDLTPKRVVVPGALTPGGEYSRSVTLTNRTRAPAEFKFDGVTNNVRITPSKGTVPPLSSVSLSLTFLAGEEAGSVTHTLQCEVTHGVTTPLEVIAEVTHPRIELLTTRLDFGLVRLKGQEVRTVRIRNTSETSDTTWSIEELVAHHKAARIAEQAEQGQRPVSGGPPGTGPLNTPRTPRRGTMGGSFNRRVPPSASPSGMLAERVSAAIATSMSAPASPRLYTRASVEPGGGVLQGYGSLAVQQAPVAPQQSLLQQLTSEGPKTYLEFFPQSGRLGPGEECDITVTCHALSDGQHHSVVKLHCPGGHLQCLEAFAAVVTPRVVVSRPKVDLGITFLHVTARFTFTLKNLALLPLEYRWDVQGLKGGELVGLLPESELDAEMKIRPESGTLLSGEDLEFQVRFTPRTTGLLTLFGICYVEGAPLPTGFCVTTCARGLDVTYELLTPVQYERWRGAVQNPRTRRKRDDVDNFQGMSHLPPEVLARLGNSRLVQRATAQGSGPPVQPPHKHLVANFGEAVPLGETRTMYLVVTNQTAIATSLHTWLDSFGVDDVSKLTGGKKTHTAGAAPKISGAGPSGTFSVQTGLPGKPGAPSQMAASTVGTQRGGGGHTASSRASPEPPIGTASVVTGHQGAGDAHSHYGPLSIAGPPSFSPSRASRMPRNQPIKLANTWEKSSPFRSPKGSEMISKRKLQHQAETVLGNKGLAVSVLPPETSLPAWGRAVLTLSAFNDMCGDYFDELHVKVGSLPSRDIPVRIGVTGTPLVVQKERVLVGGLRDRGSQWRTDLGFGQLPVGVPLTKSFHVFNTGGLDMHLGWTFYRYQDDDDCCRPEARIFDVRLEAFGDDAAGATGPDGVPITPRAQPGGAAATATTPSTSGRHSPPFAPPWSNSGGPTPVHLQGGSSGGAAAAGAEPGGEYHTSSTSQPPAAVHAPADEMQAKLLLNRAISVSRNLSVQLRQSAGSPLGASGNLAAAIQGGSVVPPLRSNLGVSSGGGSLTRLNSVVPEDLVGGMCEEEEGPQEGVRLILEPHAAPDIQPFVVEPQQAVIRGGESVKFTVSFTSHRSVPHLGYLLGEQKVFSPEMPISLKIWPKGPNGEEVGAILSGTFHPYAGQPPAPLQPLRVDLKANTVVSYLEPDARGELNFVCTSTQPPTHSSYCHIVPLSNRQSCPLMFSLSTEGPFKLVSAVPSAPQDPTLYSGTTGLTPQPPAPGEPPSPVTWRRGEMYLPPGESVDVTLQFVPPKDEGGLREDYELSGALRVTYANGDVQELPLSAHVMHPALEVRHAQQLRPAVPSTEASDAGSEHGEGSETAAPSAASTGQQRQPDPNAAGPSAGTAGSGTVGSAPSVSGSVAASNTQQVVQLERNLEAPLVFGRVHVQRPKPLELTLVNPTLVDALWAVTTENEGPRYCRPEDAGQAVMHSEAKFGPFTVRPAQGLLQGRSLKLPRTQRVTITFTPTEASEYRQTLVFGASKGRPVVLELIGTGSFDETEEHERLLYQL